MEAVAIKLWNRNFSLLAIGQKICGTIFNQCKKTTDKRKKPRKDKHKLYSRDVNSREICSREVLVDYIDFPRRCW
jgi:hypothetical protein